MNYLWVDLLSYYDVVFNLNYRNAVNRTVTFSLLPNPSLATPKFGVEKPTERHTDIHSGKVTVEGADTVFT